MADAAAILPAQAPPKWLETGVIQRNGKLTGGGALEKAIVAVIMPTTNATIAFQLTPAGTDEVEAVLVGALEFGRVVAILAHDPVHEVDAEPRCDPHDDDADELLHVQRERRLEHRPDRQTAGDEAVEDDGLIALELSPSPGATRPRSRGRAS